MSNGFLCFLLCENANAIFLFVFFITCEQLELAAEVRLSLHLPRVPCYLAVAKSPCLPRVLAGRAAGANPKRLTLQGGGFVFDARVEQPCGALPSRCAGDLAAGGGGSPSGTLSHYSCSCSSPGKGNPGLLSESSHSVWGLGKGGPLTKAFVVEESRRMQLLFGSQ